MRDDFVDMKRRTLMLPLLRKDNARDTSEAFCAFVRRETARRWCMQSPREASRVAPTRARGTAIAAGGADALFTVDRSSTELDIEVALVDDDGVVAFGTFVEVLFMDPGTSSEESTGAMVPALPVARRLLWSVR